MAMIRPPTGIAARRNPAGKRSGDLVGPPSKQCVATENELGLWLVRNWGILADIPIELLDQIEF